MSRNLTLCFYDPTLGVDQHRFTNNISLPTKMRLPYGATAMESLINDASEAFHVDWGGVWLFTDNGYIKIKEDAYGKPLRHIAAGRMLKIMEEVDAVDDIRTYYYMATKREMDERACWWRAIHAFLREIPPEYPVVLYWH